MHVPLRFSSVTFAWPGQAPLFRDLSLQLPPGWTGIVGANGSGKSTFLALACGLEPGGGTILRPRSVALCTQQVDAPPGAWRPDAEDHGILGVERDWFERWTTLSHGERKRAQVAWALAARPELLALDEPTNHVDAETRLRLVERLRRFRGIGLLVSHDRELLDTLCTRCLVLEPPIAVLRHGNWTEAGAQVRREQAEEQQQAQAARREVRRLQDEVHRRRAWTATRERARSRHGLDRHDADGRARANAARLTDGSSGAQLRQLDGRVRQARERASHLAIRKDYQGTVHFAEEPAHRDRLVRLAAGPIGIAPGIVLDIPEIEVGPRDRIAVVGPNGAGKSTLVRALRQHLEVPALVMPQEIPAEEGLATLERARGLGGARLGHLLQIVARLGSDPERLLASAAPSPGEVRKLLLALAMEERVGLLILDEPTNHLDLPSILRLEEALAGYAAALVLVSHDRPFLEALCRTTWRLSLETSGRRVLAVYPGMEA